MTESTTKSSETDRPLPGRRPFTVRDLKWAPSTPINELRNVPRLILEGIGLVWKASTRRFVVILCLQIVSAATLALQLLLGRWVLRQLIAVAPSGDRNLDSLVLGLAVLIGSTLITGIVGALVAHQTRHLAEVVLVRTFDKIMDVATSVELASFEDPHFFDQLTRARTSGYTRPMEIVTTIIALSTALLTSIGIAFALFGMHPLLLVLVVIASIPVFISTLYNSRQAYAFEYRWTPRSRERSYLFQLLTDREPAQEVRLFGATSFLRERYDALTKERLSRLQAFLRERLQVSMVGTVGSALGGAVALGALVWLILQGRIDVATAVTAGAAMQMLMGRFSGMTRSAGILVEAGMFLDDYRAFIELGEKALEGSRSVHLPPAGAAPADLPSLEFKGLEFSGVSFRYPMTNRFVLQDISIEVRQGEIVALVGENGSGKTTLVKLICQLYRPDEGKILWNGVEAARLDPRELRSQITVIFQDFVQYHLTARENISLGRVDAPSDLESISAAARRAGAHPFISELPSGYETRLGREFYGGQELSIGQWQRLALARAFFRGGSFLILDEPTAALDPRAEHELFSQMRALMEGRSALLVSHRFSSVRSADRIYVLHEGRITEAGTHSQLMEQEGQYAELFRLQAAAYLGDEIDRVSSTLPS